MRGRAARRSAPVSRRGSVAGSEVGHAGPALTPRRVGVAGWVLTGWGLLWKAGAGRSAGCPQRRLPQRGNPWHDTAGWRHARLPQASSPPIGPCHPIARSDPDVASCPGRSPAARIGGHTRATPPSRHPPAPSGLGPAHRGRGPCAGGGGHRGASRPHRHPRRPRAHRHVRVPGHQLPVRAPGTRLPQTGRGAPAHRLRARPDRRSRPSLGGLALSDPALHGRDDLDHGRHVEDPARHRLRRPARRAPAERQEPHRGIRVRLPRSRRPVVVHPVRDQHGHRPRAPHERLQPRGLRHGPRPP